VNPLEAHRAAVARWGSRALVTQELDLDGEGLSCWCSVGVRSASDPHRVDVFGTGPDFARAFADADRREHPAMHPRHEEAAR
jgi:hypothetical protein